MEILCCCRRSHSRRRRRCLCYCCCITVITTATTTTINMALNGMIYKEGRRQSARIQSLRARLCDTRWKSQHCLLLFHFFVSSLLIIAHHFDSGFYCIILLFWLIKTFFLHSSQLFHFSRAKFHGPNQRDDDDDGGGGSINKYRKKVSYLRCPHSFTFQIT